MKNLLYSSLFLIVGLQTTNASTFYVDFGMSGDTTSGNWNNITIGSTGQSSWTPQTITDLVDASGSQAAGIDLAAVATGTIGGNNDGTTLEPYSTGYPNTANRDFLYFDSGDILTVTLSNLDDSLTYSLKLFGSRNATGSRITQYDITAGTLAGSTQETLEVVDNTGNTVTFASITPDINDEIAFTVQRQSGSSFGYINVLEITSIPEPGSLALLFMGGVAFLLMRRRK